MRPPERVFLGVCAAVLACCAAYLWNPDLPRYYPLDHAWSWAVRPGVPSMSWYGRTAVALAAGLAAAGIVALTTGRQRPASGPGLSSATILGLTILTLAALALTLGLVAAREIIPLTDILQQT